MRLAAALCACGCIGSVAPAQCVVDADCAAAACIGGTCIAGSREADGGFCPLLHARWSEIDQRLLQVGCGVRSSNCHEPGGASGLDFTGDPYARLVGRPSTDGGFTLVVPGDPDNSFLYVKLRLTTDVDPVYGSGMPPEHPGQTCADAVEAVRQWIAAGAGHDG